MYSPLTSHILGLLFPKERVPASIPQAPREVGTTLTSIVAFPCVRAILSANTVSSNSTLYSGASGGGAARVGCDGKLDPVKWGSVGRLALHRSTCPRRPLFRRSLD